MINIIVFHYTNQPLKFAPGLIEIFKMYMSVVKLQGVLEGLKMPVTACKYRPLPLGWQ